MVEIKKKYVILYTIKYEQERNMRILGIDPGFAITGYSIIDYIGNKFKLIKSGAILTSQNFISIKIRKNI